MNKEIKLNYKGTEYTLTYNRMAVKIIESQGFELEKFSKQGSTFLVRRMIELVFSGSFLANHRKVSQNTIDEIYKSCPDKSGLISNLTEMINDCYNSLTEEPKDGDEGNVTWEVVDLTPKTSQK